MGIMRENTLYYYIMEEKKCADELSFLIEKRSEIQKSYLKESDKEMQDSYLSMLNEIESEIKQANRSLSEAEKDLAITIKAYAEMY